MLSLALSRAPPSSRGLQAQVWKASHTDLNAPSSACTGFMMRCRHTDRKDVEEINQEVRGRLFFIFRTKMDIDLQQLQLYSSLFSAPVSSHSVAHYNDLS